MSEKELTNFLVDKIKNYINEGYSEKQIVDEMLSTLNITLDQLEKAASSFQLSNEMFKRHVINRCIGSLTGASDRSEKTEDIIALNNADIVLCYARKHPNLHMNDIRALANVIIARGSLEQILNFKKIYPYVDEDLSEIITNAMLKKVKEEKRNYYFSDLHMPIKFYYALDDDRFGKTPIEDDPFEDNDIFDSFNIVSKIGTSEKYEELSKLVPKIQKEFEDAWALYHYAKSQKFSNEHLEQLAHAIVNTGNPDCIYLFAKDFPQFRTELMVDAIIETGDAEYISEFLNLRDAPIEKLIYGLLQTVDNKPVNKYDIKVSEEELNRLNQAYQIQNAHYIYEAAKFVRDMSKVEEDDSLLKIDIPLELFEDALIKSGSLEYIYKFAKNIPTANIKKIEDYVISTQDGEYIYKFALYVPGSSREKLLDALSCTSDKKYICASLELIPDAPIDKLSLAYKKLIKKEQVSKILEGLVGIVDKQNIDDFFNIIPEDVIELSVGEIVDCFVQLFEIEDRLKELSEEDKNNYIRKWIYDNNDYLLQNCGKKYSPTKSLKRPFPFVNNKKGK